jgi:hypothetical protein
MATFDEHCEETRRKLGRPWNEVHQWLDELQPSLGPEHRKVRHNVSGVVHVIETWGFEAGAAACLHIYRDEHSHHKVGTLWLPKA